MVIVDVPIACHNRVTKSIQAIDSLLALESNSLYFRIYLVDDGSSDGTSATIASRYPQVSLIQGNGKLYWAASMALAESQIPKDNSWTLWLNDDVVINPELKNSLLKIMRENQDSIIVGEIFDYDGRFQYGLVYRGKTIDVLDSKSSTELPKLLPATFNGNFVLIPRDIRIQVGAIDGKFSHGYADIDYGLRATKLGINLFPFPGIAGWVESRTRYGVSADRAKISQLITSRKGQPLKDQIRFFRRHAGKSWAIYVIKPFLGIIKYKIINLRLRFKI
jgi:glycosyltransferase involved in cell wall biosynthesis